MAEKSPRINNNPPRWVCFKCGCDDIEAKLWVNLNTFLCTDTLGHDLQIITPNMMDTHCVICGTDVPLSTLEHYTANLNTDDDSIKEQS